MLVSSLCGQVLPSNRCFIEWYTFIEFEVLNVVDKWRRMKNCMTFWVNACKNNKNWINKKFLLKLFFFSSASFSSCSFSIYAWGFFFSFIRMVLRALLLCYCHYCNIDRAATTPTKNKNLIQLTPNEFDANCGRFYMSIFSLHSCIIIIETKKK